MIASRRIQRFGRSDKPRTVRFRSTRKKPILSRFYFPRRSDERATRRMRAADAPQCRRRDGVCSTGHMEKEYKPRRTVTRSTYAGHSIFRCLRFARATREESPSRSNIPSRSPALISFPALGDVIHSVLCNRGRFQIYFDDITPTFRRRRRQQRDARPRKTGGRYFYKRTRDAFRLMKLCLWFGQEITPATLLCTDISIYSAGTAVAVCVIRECRRCERYLARPPPPPSLVTGGFNLDKQMKRQLRCSRSRARAPAISQSRPRDNVAHYRALWPGLV